MLAVLILIIILLVGIAAGTCFYIFYLKDKLKKPVPIITPEESVTRGETSNGFKPIKVFSSGIQSFY